MLEGWEISFNERTKQAIAIPVFEKHWKKTRSNCLLWSVIGVVSHALGWWGEGFGSFYIILTVISIAGLLSNMMAWILLVRSFLRDKEKLLGLLPTAAFRSSSELVESASENLMYAAASVEYARQNKNYDAIDEFRSILRERYDIFKAFNLVSDGYGRYYEMAAAYLEKEAAQR